MSNAIPLSIILESARAGIKKSINQVIEDTKLPAFLVEGILMECVAEIRSMKTAEIMASIENLNKGTEETETITE